MNLMDVGQNKISVLYIGSCSRSGSTLLDRMLGQVEGCFSVGELSRIWDRGFQKNQLCGCGKPFRECEFWNEAAREAYGGMEALDVAEVLAVKRRVESVRSLPGLYFSGGSAGFRSRFRRYSEVLYRLYHGIQKASGCRVIIDSSKEPSHGYVLNAVSGLDLHVVHLVRDSRAVAFSWRRQKRRPEIHWKEEDMERFGLAWTSMKWNIVNLSVDLLKRRTSSHGMLNYETLSSSPNETLAGILRRLGWGEEEIAATLGKGLVFGVNHTVSGNPMRFEKGELRIRTDEEWKSKMTHLRKFLVTALTFPLLWKYGYFDKRR
jgi:hypothetical protein